MSTKLDRQMAASRLSKLFDMWLKMSDADLLTECRQVFPSIVSATRDECLKFLALDYVERYLIP